MHICPSPVLSRLQGDDDDSLRSVHHYEAMGGSEQGVLPSSNVYQM